MKLARILSSVLNKTKMAVGTLAMQLLLAWLPKPLVTYMKIWLPLMLVVFSYFKIFHMILGFTFFIGLLDLTNLNFSQFVEKLLLCKNFIIYNILSLIDKVFNTSYTSGPPSVEIKIGNPDKDLFGIPSPIDRFEQEQALYQATIHSENEPIEKGWGWGSYLMAGVAIIVVVGCGYLLYNNYDDIMQEIRNLRGGRHDGPGDGNPGSGANLATGNVAPNVPLYEINPKSIVSHIKPLSGDQTEFILKSGEKMVVPKDKLDIAKTVFDNLLNKQDYSTKIQKLCEDHGLSLLNSDGSAVQVLGDKTPIASTPSLPDVEATPVASTSKLPDMSTKSTPSPLANVGSIINPSTHIVNEGVVQKIDSKTIITDSSVINKVIDTIPVSENPFEPLTDFNMSLGQHLEHIDRVGKYFDTGLASSFIKDSFSEIDRKYMRSLIETYKNINFHISRADNTEQLKYMTQMSIKEVNNIATRIHKQYIKVSEDNNLLSEVTAGIIETESNLLNAIESSTNSTPSITAPIILLTNEFNDEPLTPEERFNHYINYKNKINKLNDIFDEVLTYKIHPYEYRILTNLINYYKNINIGIVNSRCIEEFLYLSKRACMDCEIKRVQTLYNYEEHICKKDQFVNIINYTTDIERELLFEIRSIFNYY